jgi:hypothetical protein
VTKVKSLLSDFNEIGLAVSAGLLIKLAELGADGRERRIQCWRCHGDTAASGMRAISRLRRGETVSGLERFHRRREIYVCFPNEDSGQGFEGNYGASTATRSERQQVCDIRIAVARHE